MRGATHSFRGIINRAEISIHAPHAGCDSFLVRSLPTCYNISIHAPHAGCDAMAYYDIIYVSRFQSTHPMRGATEEDVLFVKTIRFQSTHPMRGATRADHSKTRNRCISIHAPHAGCDGAWSAGLSCLNAFQSTHPMRGATFHNILCAVDNANFNPRTPCGVRPVRRRSCRTANDFNPRTPCGVRRGNVLFGYRVGKDISIHAPHAGCDGKLACFLCQLHQFQSTHPMRGATSTGNLHTILRGISIHAPHAGCDSFGSFPYSCPTYFNPRTPCGVRHSPSESFIFKKLFQSTHPMRGATERKVPEEVGEYISIHAPHAGCDKKGV